MYSPISRLSCLLLSILALHCLVAIGNGPWDENNQEVVISSAPVDATLPYSREASEDPTAPFSSGTAIEATPQSQHAFLKGSAYSRDCIELDNSITGGMNDSNRDFERADQYPAPEVVLRLSSGCANEEFVNWRLSSRDKPRVQPVIPHGPLMTELIVDKPIDFVELKFDGKPLKPTAYTSVSPLSYSLPCPAPGPHWLQARYLSGSVWSHYSHPIRFEVSLPQQPRIIAASGFDRAPTPLARNSLTSITTHSIKVHLADVNPGDHIVAYVDGKPLPTHCDACVENYSAPMHAESELCCGLFKLAGVVIPGVHKLTVRVVGCSGECTITSPPSNEIAFHYYVEDFYLLRPGSDCCNDELSPSLNTTNHKKQMRTDSPVDLQQAAALNLLRITANEFEPAVASPGRTRLTSPEGLGIRQAHEVASQGDGKESFGDVAQKLNASSGFQFVSYPEAPTANRQVVKPDSPVVDTGRVATTDAATSQARSEAEEQAAFEAAVARFNAAKAGSDEHGVRRAQEGASTAHARAAHEWSKAASRIAEAEANASFDRAQKVVGPPSPFYFAAAAHFPIREFGLRGEAHDHDGIVIYEDMKFAFDQHGNYQVHFRASPPKMPATVRLQFQIQPHRQGPWYTVTLAPIEFPYPTAKSDQANCSGSNCGDDHSRCSGDSQNCCGEARECVCTGHSEILRRCYGEMGQDARIRRTGTARFGFGINVPN